MASRRGDTGMSPSGTTRLHLCFKDRTQRLPIYPTDPWEGWGGATSETRGCTSMIRDSRTETSVTQEIRRTVRVRHL